jgi:diguanylate cyclase (GGDEF)-like protein
LKSGQQSGDFYAQLWRTIQSGQVWQGDVIDRRKDGSLYTVDEIITPLFDEKGVITHFIAIQHDITGRNKEADHARHLAYHDSLTDLPNRACFFGLLETALVNASRNKHMVATLFVDLDHFKPVNDTMGHQIGDQLLVAVAERIRVALRHADTVARIGGDEFVILINELEDAHIATKLAQKLVETLAHPFVLRGQAIHISASIGVAIYPMDGVDPQILLMHADQAMYRAKCCGGNQVQSYLAMPAENR